MRLALIACALAALILSGCARDKSFEKEILGHQAPESPNDTGWARTPPPPPPPPPPASPPAAYAPPPSAPPARPSAPAPAVAAPAASAPTTATAAGPDFRPKPFTPAPPEPPAVEKPGAVLFEQQGKPASAGPAAAPGAKASPAAQPAPAPGEAAAPGERAYFTFEVGEFAHAASGKELMAALEAKGFSTRMDQAKRNNKTFYKVFAGKEGSRAALEAELFGDGVTEPRLAEERPAGSAPAGKAAASAPAPAAAPAAKAQPAAGPKVSAPIAPPIVEPAPPLPDGYVPPPKKTGS